MGRSRFADEERDGPEVPPRGVGEVIQGLLADRRMRRGVALGRLVIGWREVVGEPLAAETGPISLDGGELTVAASSAAWAAQIRFLAEEVRSRANGALGSEEIRRVRVVVRGAR